MEGSERLFPSFFLGGFECSSHVDPSGERRDLLALTQHDRYFREDYELVRSEGVLAIRDGVHWHLCDVCGRYEFGSVAPRVRAARELGLTVIWDLFHYGYPEDLDPSDAAFAPRFGDYAYAFARWLSQRVPGPRWYVPVNEPSFFAWAGGEVAWFAPCWRGRGWELKVRLLEAAIAGSRAIRAADPQARLVAVDPVIHVVAPADAPELAEDAARFSALQYQAWDMLVGRLAPEVGGSADLLDVVGVNYYPHNQWEHTRGGCLAPDDPRRKPFRQILLEVYQRYRRPMIVSETAAAGAYRPAWLRYMVDECLAAIRLGVDLQGICHYPVIDMPGWIGGFCSEFLNYGLWDLVPDPQDAQEGACSPVLRRQPYAPVLMALREAQQRVAAAGLGAGRARQPALVT
jgi:hypothetical protein